MANLHGTRDMWIDKKSGLLCDFDLRITRDLVCGYLKSTFEKAAYQLF